jgi:hypothetical protein
MDAGAMIRSYREQQGSRIRIGPLTANGRSVPDVGATTKADGSIIVNSEGRYMTGMGSLSINGGPWVPASIYEYGQFRGMSRVEARAVMLIHELLHAANAIPHDRNQAQNEANTASVIARCITMAPRPYRIIPVTPLTLPDISPQMRPLIIGLGGGTLGTLLESYFFDNWVRNIRRGRGKLGKVTQIGPVR